MLILFCRMWCDIGTAEDEYHQPINEYRFSSGYNHHLRLPLIDKKTCSAHEDLDFITPSCIEYQHTTPTNQPVRHVVSNSQSRSVTLPNDVSNELISYGTIAASPFVSFASGSVDVLCSFPGRTLHCHFLSLSRRRRRHKPLVNVRKTEKEEDERKDVVVGPRGK